MFTAAGQLDYIDDRNGQRTDFTYDGAGKLTRVADRAGLGPGGQVDVAPVGPHVPEPVDQVGQQRRRIQRPVHRGHRGLGRVDGREVGLR